MSQASAELVRVAGARHFVMADKARLVAARLTTFLRA
jgi:hypothetical protein